MTQYYPPTLEQPKLNVTFNLTEFVPSVILDPTTTELTLLQLLNADIAISATWSLTSNNMRSELFYPSGLVLNNYLYRKTADKILIILLSKNNSELYTIHDHWKQTALLQIDSINKASIKVSVIPSKTLLQFTFIKRFLCLSKFRYRRIYENYKWYLIAFEHQMISFSSPSK